METSVIRFIILGVISGLTKGAGVLPAGPLTAAVGGTVMFNTTVTPTEKPFVLIIWNIDGRTIISSSSGGNFPEPGYEGRITIFISTGSLELRNLALSDSGQYVVTILPQGAGAMSGSIRLEVLEPVSNVVATANGTDLLEFKDSVRLSCSSSGSSLSFLWLNNNTEVTASDRVHLTNGGSTLTIASVTRYDQGPFTCRVTSPVSSATSQPIRLNVYSPVANLVVTANDTDLVEFNSSVRLSCSSSGSSLSFLWLNGSSEVTENDRVQLTDGNTTLTIVHVTRYDQGPFMCRVSNPVSTGISGPVSLTISYGPEDIKLTKYPLQEYFEEGSNITLNCSAVSRPSAVFYWFLNADKLSDTGPELTLMNIQINHSGSYSCQAFNPKTQRYETSQPSVVSVLEKISGASVTSSSTQPIEGASVNLTCEAAGSVVTRKWKKGDSYVLPDHIHFYDNNRVLSFQTLKKTDSGEYSCEISNPVSNDAAKYFMFVNYGPENVGITGPSEIHLNQTLTLKCSAESTPAASYTWFLNGTVIHHSAVFTKVMTKYSDSGQYTCEAMNIITGRTSSAVHGLTVKALPEKTLGCSSGCIAGIVIACLVVCGAAAGGGGYYIYRKKQSFNSKGLPDSATELNERTYETPDLTYENPSVVNETPPVVYENPSVVNETPPVIYENS